jgi:rhamnose transport system permease protein
MLLLACVAYFAAPAFLTVSNMRQIVLNQAILLIGALGISMIIIAGEIDISIGAILGLAAMLAGKLDLAGAATPLVFLVPVLAGLALGAWNGALTVWGRVHSIVITLGMMFVLRGVLIQSMESQLNNFNLRLTGLASYSFGGQNVSEGLPLILLLAFGVAVAVFVFLRSTVTGRRLFAIGGDRPSAALLGVKSSVSIPIVFAVSGALIGFAGLLTSARFGQIQSTVGEGFELKAIAAAVIGGTHIMGGRGSVLGVILGALFLGVVSNLLIMLHVPEYWDNAIIGAMILLAVVMDAAVSRIREGRHS